MRTLSTGFGSDAAYFDVLASRTKHDGARKEFELISDTLRQLPRNDGATFANHWEQRAKVCRTLADQFKSQPCREQLYRLANTYDLLAEQVESPGHR